MARRRLLEEDVLAVAKAPEQVIDIRMGRVLAQSIRALGEEQQVYLSGVVVDVWPEGLEIVTAYKTSRITKYWRGVQ